MVTGTPTCQREHYLAHSNVDWDSILESQKGQPRHKCAACAYELGFRDAIAYATRRITGLFEEEEGWFQNL